MVIVDTTVWIDYLGGVTTPHTSWLDRELTRQRLALTDLILSGNCKGFGMMPGSLKRIRILLNSRFSVPVESIWP
jgi:hypothetical protein